jgi:hypothetical protein
MQLELDDCIASREVHIYRGSPLETLCRGSCAGAGERSDRLEARSDRQWRCEGKTLNNQVPPW